MEPCRASFVIRNTHEVIKGQPVVDRPIGPTNLVAVEAHADHGANALTILGVLHLVAGCQNFPLPCHVENHSMIMRASASHPPLLRTASRLPSARLQVAHSNARTQQGLTPVAQCPC